MTREQQQSTRELDTSMQKVLTTFGWQPDGRRWRHPRFHNGTISCTTVDAWLQTRAMPQLGWP